MKLKKLNLTVETDSEIKKDKYISQGYETLDTNKEKDVQEMTFAELKEIAEKRGIDFDKNIKKAELITLLQSEGQEND